MYKVTSSLQFTKGSQSDADTESEAQWAPDTDVYLADKGLVVAVELAGMRREDLELTVEGNQLRVSGQRPDGCRTGHCKFLVMEINYGTFERLIELPAGYDLTKARASYQNGFLRIDVPAVSPAASHPLSLPVSGE